MTCLAPFPPGQAGAQLPAPRQGRRLTPRPYSGSTVGLGAWAQRGGIAGMDRQLHFASGPLDIQRGTLWGCCSPRCEPGKDC